MAASRAFAWESSAVRASICAWSELLAVIGALIGAWTFTAAALPLVIVTPDSSVQSKKILAFTPIAFAIRSRVEILISAPFIAESSVVLEIPESSAILALPSLLRFTYFSNKLKFIHLMV